MKPSRSDVQLPCIKSRMYTHTHKRVTTCDWEKPSCFQGQKPWPQWKAGGSIYKEKKVVHYGGNHVVATCWMVGIRRSSVCAVWGAHSVGYNMFVCTLGWTGVLLLLCDCHVLSGCHGEVSVCSLSPSDACMKLSGHPWESLESESY